MDTKMNLNELNTESIAAMTEEEVFNLLTNDIEKLPKAERAYYSNMINKSFDFRSISSRNRSLKGDLSMFGYKFFTSKANTSTLMGIKRKVQCL